MSNLLLDETPLMVLPKLAAKIGLNEAIVLQQIHYWAVKKLNEHEGFYWVYNSYESWREQFPFFSKATIGRSFRNLEDLGLIITGNFNKLSFDKTKWYRIDYAVLAEYEDKPCNDGLLKPLVSSEPSNVPICYHDDSKMIPRTYQNEPTIPKTISKTTTEITHKDIKDIVEQGSPSSGKPDNIPYKEIVDYLNLRANTKYKHSAGATQKLIRARYNEGFTLEDFKQAIDNKVATWLHDAKMQVYLRPQTLFSTKFEGYLNERVNTHAANHNAPIQYDDGINF